jgi:hypothetical protein
LSSIVRIFVLNVRTLVLNVEDIFGGFIEKRPRQDDPLMEPGDV